MSDKIETADDVLKELYYNQNFLFGRDKLFAKAKKDFPNVKVTKRFTMEWLKKQETYQLHRRKQTRTTIQATKVKKPREQLQVDLVDLSQYQTKKGNKWIINVIDMFSKKAWSRPMKNKGAKTVAEAMESMLKETGTVSVLRSDNGKEFLNKDFEKVLKKAGLKHVTSRSYTPQSQGGVERFNGTLKSMIEKLITSGKRQWDNHLSSLIENYNDSVHTATKMTPNDAEQKSNRRKVRKRIKKARKNIKVTNQQEEINVGDRVRIVLDKNATNVKSGPNYSTRIYVVSSKTKPRKKSTATQYFLKGFKSVLYATDLYKVPANTVTTERQQKYEVSKIVDKRTRDGIVQYRVRWKGYRAADDTWETEGQLIEDVPKMVGAFERQ